MKFLDLVEFLKLPDLVESKLHENMTVRGFATLMTSPHSCLEVGMDQVYRVFALFFTIPITTASAERSFSKLKMIKHYLRYSVLQGILSLIEHSSADKLDLQSLIQCGSFGWNNSHNQ